MQATQSTVETWLPIVGYEGIYEVSDLGRIRSLPRSVHTRLGKRTYQGRVLKQHRQQDHYAQVRTHLNGEYVLFRNHVEVAAAFLGPRPDGQHVCHNNGDKSDNHLSNLRYDSPSANNMDAVRHGRNHYASRTHCGHGHEFTPENTIIRSDSSPGARRCLICRRESRRRAHERSRAVA